MLSLWRVLTVCYCVMVTCRSRASKLTRSRRTIFGTYPLCPLGCDSCSSLNGCVTCSSGFFLDIQTTGHRQIGRCVEICPKGYYGLAKKDFGICRKCPMAHCNGCTDPTTCTSCRAPYIVYGKKCVADCPNGLWYAEYTQQCLHQVDCVLSSWSEWAVCKRNGQTCGYKYGVQSRKRYMLQSAKPGGKQCELSEEVRRCRLLYRYCSDILTNSSEPSKHMCSLRKRERYRRRKGRGKRRRMSKMCRGRRKRKYQKKKKQRKNSRKENRRKKGKSTRFVDERTTISSKAFNKLYYDIPNLKTNQIDRLLKNR